MLTPRISERSRWRRRHSNLSSSEASAQNQSRSSLTRRKQTFVTGFVSTAWNSGRSLSAPATSLQPCLTDVADVERLTRQNSTGTSEKYAAHARTLIIIRQVEKNVSAQFKSLAADAQNAVLTASPALWIFTIKTRVRRTRMFAACAAGLGTTFKRSL